MKTKRSFKYYGFWMVAISFFTFYFAAAMMNDALNTIIPALEGMYGWTRGAITTAVTIGGFISIVLMFVLTTLIMKKGVKLVLVPSLFVLGIATLIMANSPVYSTFSIFMAIIQMFAATMMVVPGILLANWYVKKRGRVLGIATIGAPFGGATFNLIAGNVMAVRGFPFAYTGVGIAIIILGIIAWIFVVNKPEDVGLAPDGADMTPEEIADLKATMESKDSKWTLGSLLKVKEIWLYIFAFGLFSLIISGTMSQLIPRFLDVGVIMPNALLYLSIASVLGMGISYLWGWLDDKITTRKTCVIFALTFALSAVCFYFATATTPILLILAIVGVASMTGGLPNLEISILASVFGRKEYVNANRYGRVGTNIFRSFGYMAMGLVFDKTGSYNLTYVMFFFFAIIAAVLVSQMKGKYYEDENK